MEKVCCCTQANLGVGCIHETFTKPFEPPPFQPIDLGASAAPPARDGDDVIILCADGVERTGTIRISK